MNIKSTSSLAWMRYLFSLCFFRTILASLMMSLSLAACSENLSEGNQPAVNSQSPNSQHFSSQNLNSQNNANPQQEAELKTVESNSVPSINASKKPIPAVSQALPVSSKVSWVLDGTDLIKISEIKHSSSHSDTDWSGQYRSEQGGSLLELRIESHGQGQWSLSRDYSEPALEKHTKQYDLQAIDEGLVSQSADLSVKKTAEGVLVFEARSGIASIPDSYWVHYLKRD